MKCLFIYYVFLGRSEKTSLMVPKTISCRVMSIDMLKDLITSVTTTCLCSKDNGSEQHRMGVQQSLCRVNDDTSSMLLAGLHACGDLSVTMLRQVPILYFTSFVCFSTTIFNVFICCYIFIIANIPFVKYLNVRKPHLLSFLGPFWGANKLKQLSA